MNHSPKLDQYIEDHSSACSALLQQIERETYRQTTHPHMLSGFVQGRFLSMISRMLQPKRILEIGTFTGYATLCLAEGLSEDGEIITIDHNQELQSKVQNYFNQSEKGHQIQFIIADALEELHKLKDEKFDIIFLDADKENYPTYYTLLKNNLCSGGMMIVDNVLWYGKVVEDTIEDVQTLPIQTFNTMVRQDDDMEVLIVPLRDGLSLIQKKTQLSG